MEFVVEGCALFSVFSFLLVIGLLLWVCWHVANESNERHIQKRLKQNAIIEEIQQNRQKLYQKEQINQYGNYKLLKEIK